MSPRAPLQNQGDRGSGDSVILGDGQVLLPVGSPSSNLDDLLLTQFGPAVSRAPGSLLGTKPTPMAISSWGVHWSRGASASFGVSISSVICITAQEKVIGPDTGAPVAFMEAEQIVGNAAIGQNPGHPMGGVVGAVDEERTVAAPPQLRGPYPAGTQLGAVLGNRAVLVDFLPEAVGQRARAWPFAVQNRRGERAKLLVHRKPTFRCHARDGYHRRRGSLCGEMT